MSFILEALKKSENERQRKIGPSLADVQARPRPTERPWWVIAVGALLVVNVGVLLVVLLRDGDSNASEQRAHAPSVVEQPSPAPAAAAPPVRTPPATRPLQQARPVARDPSVRSLADEAGFDASVDEYAAEHPNLAAASRVPEGPPIVRPIESPSVAPATIRPAGQPQRTEFSESLPTLQDLAASGTQLPDLHLDIHVHSTNPAERFVFVNMRKYIEGQALSEGPTVERIATDGVVLNHQGMRFLLPRQ
jgi:general secretion pathway protein B